MSVGSAEQLISGITEDDDTVYSFRTSGGSVDIGDREDLVRLGGGTIAWNQQSKSTVASSTSYSVEFTNNNNGTYTVNGTATGGTSVFTVNNTYTAVLNHIYLFSLAGAVNSVLEIQGYTGSRTKLKIFKNTYAEQAIVIRVPSGSTCDNEVVIPQIFDLTLMFGKTIADYINTLETTTPGAGVAWFRKYFPKPYYAYNAGTLYSIKPYSHVMTGFNQFNITTGKARILGTNQSSNALYQITGTYSALTFKDLAGNAIDVTVDAEGYFSTPNECELFVTGGNATDTCVHLVWDGEKDGDWEKFEENAYEFDSSLELRGIPTLVEKEGYSTKLLGFNGDEYYADGSVSRKYGVYTITGSENWSKNGSRYQFYANFTPQSKADLNSCAVICNTYLQGAQNTQYAGLANKTICMFQATAGASNRYIGIQDDSYTDATALKAYLKGRYDNGNPVIVYYEVDSPTTESATPYTNPQIVSDWGTEEFVDGGVATGVRDVTIPTGQFTKYQANLRAKLEMAPSNPEEDGDYIVRHEDGVNSYISVDDANLAHKDDYCPDFYAGNMVAETTANDTEPYVFRQAGNGIAVSDREVDEVHGLSLAVNQLVKNGNFADTRAWSRNRCSVTVSNNVGTFTCTDTQYAVWGLYQNPVVAKGHKALVMATAKKSSINVSNISLQQSSSTMSNVIGDRLATSPENNVWCDLAFMGISVMDSGIITVGINLVYSSADLVTIGDTLSVKNFRLFDLTAMFGSQIADYIYNLETATPGAGVALFRSIFPKPYYAYNAGSLESVCVSEHKTTGFNQWDEEWEVGGINENTGATTSDSDRIRSKNFQKCIGGATYYVKTPYAIKVLFYDANKNYLTWTYSNNETKVFPTNAYFFKIATYSNYGTTYNHDICINFSKDGSRNGEYEPYVAHSYALDSSIDLRGLLKLDSNNKFYADGDIYKGDGTVERRYGIVDLGTLDWVSGYSGVYSISLTDIKLAPNVSSVVNAVSTKYVVTSYNDCVDKCLCAWSGGSCVLVKDSNITSSDIVSGKIAKLNGVYLIYELTTPTTEQAASYTSAQFVDAWGTEQYIDYPESQGTRDFVLPVGHLTKYQPNLKAKLEVAPNSPASDGDYIMRRSDGINSYVGVQWGDRITSLEEDKADKDGYYEELYAGGLTSNISSNDKVPYLFRTSGGNTDIGNRETDEIVGGTIAWNQLAYNRDWAGSGLTSTYDSATKSYHITGTTSSYAGVKLNPVVGNVFPMVNGHKYLVTFTKTNVTDTSVGQIYVLGTTTQASAKHASFIFTAGETYANAEVQCIWSTSGLVVDTTIKNLQVYDLTQMFGTTIANYISTLESSTPGAGVAYFRSLFPKPSYAYNAGELMSVKTSEHRMTHFNQLVTPMVRNSSLVPFDITTATRVIKGQPYYLSVQNVSASSWRFYISLYDLNGNVVNDIKDNMNPNYITVSSGANVYQGSSGVYQDGADTTNKYKKLTFNIDGYVYVNIGGTNTSASTVITDPCMNISWDGERDGEYEPYSVNSYALDPELELRGIPKLDANNKLYYDGDRYSSDGSVVRRYGIVDLGTLDWGYVSGVPIFTCANNPPAKTRGEQVVCVKYSSAGHQSSSDQANKTVQVLTDGAIWIKDTSYTDATTFKTAMNGVYLVYELATPTTEDATPYTNPQIVDDWGTEEYVDTRDVPIPVGHDTDYQVNLKAKLEMAPNSPDGDGDYIVRQTSGQNAYVPLEKELPAAPGTEGSYVLTCVVDASGNPTFSWVEQ